MKKPLLFLDYNLASESHSNADALANNQFNTVVPNQSFIKQDQLGTDLLMI